MFRIFDKCDMPTSHKWQLASEICHVLLLTGVTVAVAALALFYFPQTISPSVLLKSGMLTFTIAAASVLIAKVVSDKLLQKL